MIIKLKENKQKIKDKNKIIKKKERNKVLKRNIYDINRKHLSRMFI